VLAFLWVAFVAVTLVAFVAILITGRYPRRMFDFNVGVLRWTWRVNAYALALLNTDSYPPFSLADDDTYPATLHVEYPERLSRGLVLVKSWLLAVPHLRSSPCSPARGVSPETTGPRPRCSPVVSSAYSHSPQAADCCSPGGTRRGSSTSSSGSTAGCSARSPTSR
jgi:hypothetical protein